MTPAVKKGMAEGLLDRINCVQLSIKLTVEVEKNRTLPFLDTLLQRKMAAWTSLSTKSPLTPTGT